MMRCVAPGSGLRGMRQRFKAFGRSARSRVRRRRAAPGCPPDRQPGRAPPFRDRRMRCAGIDGPPGRPAPFLIAVDGSEDESIQPQ
jgi:hypothetical protein